MMDSDRIDPLLDCLMVVARAHGQPATRAGLSAGLPVTAMGLTPALFARAADRAGLASRVARLELKQLQPSLLPVILLLKDNRACVVLSRDEVGDYEVLFPEAGQGATLVSPDDLQGQYAGRAIFVRPRFKVDANLMGKRLTAATDKHWFWSAFFEQIPLYRDVMLAALLVNVFALVVPIFSMNVYDRVIPTHAVDTLWMLVAGVVGVIVMDYTLKLVRSHFVDLAGARIDVKLSGLIMERVLGMRLAEKPASVGSFAQSLRSFESVRDFMSSATMTALVDIPFSLIFLLAIAWISWPLVFIPMAGALFVLIYSLIIKKQVQVLTAEVHRASAVRNATLVESLSAMETLKTLGAESHIQRRWESIAAQLAKVAASARLKTHRATGVVAAFSSFCMVGNVVVGVYLIDQRLLTLGGLIASGMLIGRLIGPLSQVVGLIMQYENAKLSLQLIESQMEKGVERPAEAKFVHRERLEGHIEFKDVSFAYPEQESESLKDVSFKIAAGEKVAIIGRTGSGKTTINRLMLGLYAPHTGAVLVDGIDLRQLDPADLRSNVGAVEQNAVLFLGSLRDNITFAAPHAEDNQIIQAADVGLLTEMVNQHPRGFDMPVGERGELLSGGQRQCVAIARAVLNSPNILLFDEPTSAMDFSTEKRFVDGMRAYSRGKTMVVVTHRMSLLAMVDRVIVMDRGRVVADGPKDIVMKNLGAGKVGQGE